MKFGKRALSYADPVAGNSLPVHVQEETFIVLKDFLRHTLLAQHTLSSLVTVAFFIYFTLAHVALVFVFNCNKCKNLSV